MPANHSFYTFPVLISLWNMTSVIFINAVDNGKRLIYDTAMSKIKIVYETDTHLRKEIKNFIQKKQCGIPQLHMKIVSWKLLTYWSEEEKTMKIGLLSKMIIIQTLIFISKWGWSPFKIYSSCATEEMISTCCIVISTW